MISLIILPYLISFLAIRYLEIPVERVMQLNMPLNNVSQSNFTFFNQSLLETKIDFLEIRMTGNTMEDEIKLDFAALETRRILKENDSVHGIKIVFDDSAKYNSLVRILNIMDQEIARYYIYYDQMFWFYHIPENPDKIYLDIHRWQCVSGSYYKKEKSEFPYFIFDNKLIWLPISLLLLTFLGVVLIVGRIKSTY
ncbi:MAG: hypothetical protein IPI31_10055 [Bacteroidetes bacterium]|jgi:hypothetical protein|nr:hypothetical protein [Bacteroidota bacterium]